MTGQVVVAYTQAGVTKKFDSIKWHNNENITFLMNALRDSSMEFIVPYSGLNTEFVLRKTFISRIRNLKSLIDFVQNV